MSQALATSKARVREWPSYHGHPTPKRNDPFEVGEEFVRALHHRLCQPLTALSCALEIMQMGRESDPKLTNQIQAALVQSEKISEMMGTFRQMFEASAPANERHCVSLGRVLQEVMEDLAPLADLQQISMQIEQHYGADGVDIRQKSLRQALWSVVQHCIETTPRQGRITISGRDLQLIICDQSHCTGAELDNSFDPFSYTANRSSASQVSNLPLALARSLVTAAGGEMTVGAHPLGRCFILKCLPGQPTG